MTLPSSKVNRALTLRDFKRSLAALAPVVAQAAEPWGIRIAPHLFHETMVHVMASIPNANYLEYMDWNDDLWIEPVLPSKTGMMSPPERPGHGLTFRPEILRDHRIGGQRLKD